MPSEVTVAVTNPPLQVSVNNFLDANGNSAVVPSAPGFTITGPATVAPHPTEAHTAVVTLAGTPGTVYVTALYPLFTLSGTINVEPGPAVTATLNISA